MAQAQFPAIRMRRTRVHNWSRNLVREARLNAHDLIWPLFIHHGDMAEAVSSLPGVYRWPVAQIVERAKEAVSLGIPVIALFPNTQDDRRTDDAREALNPDNLMCQAIKAVKDALGDDIGVLTDVALDPYTSHGQDGLVNADGYVANDATLEVLVGQALNQARAGADIIAPSDMMDGRIGASREALEKQAFANVQIMAYSAKYASSYYGPFRDAVGSTGTLKGDKRTYQIDPSNGQEAIREIALDIAEGADSVMVKPGLAYLDIVERAVRQFDIPIFAYQVSGEYALIEAGAAAGIADRDALLMEQLIAFKRAGCTGILTYHAKDAAEILHNNGQF